ncbi:hypothetical protein RFI_14319 [Reticulomyxa filosa]|uniref:Uncharacterized protein n=1 Tax=Reticulomyxa filosa TaxID=46433 RepID=X6NC51_RETFI|nr:hypothetical protein RFI_14319 [Reticulomyxa filosa]|eukprot:ETO22872.1 hypothetical protein RFI_14319 [Reticulomyxa filosa]
MIPQLSSGNPNFTLGHKSPQSTLLIKIEENREIPKETEFDAANMFASLPSHRNSEFVVVGNEESCNDGDNDDDDVLKGTERDEEIVMDERNQEAMSEEEDYDAFARNISVTRTITGTGTGTRVGTGRSIHTITSVRFSNAPPSSFTSHEEKCLSLSPNEGQRHDDKDFHNPFFHQHEHHDAPSHDPNACDTVVPPSSSDPLSQPQPQAQGQSQAQPLSQSQQPQSQLQLQLQLQLQSQLQMQMLVHLQSQSQSQSQSQLQDQTKDEIMDIPPPKMLSLQVSSKQNRSSDDVHRDSILNLLGDEKISELIYQSSHTASSSSNNKLIHTAPTLTLSNNDIPEEQPQPPDLSKDCCQCTIL